MTDHLPGPLSNPASHPGPDAGEARQRRLLARNRALATGLLLAAAAGFTAATIWGGDGFWIGWARAASEAAIIGALADWFAVTALFRRPLGLPIPHTAIVPRNQARIADGLGGFIERNFLDPGLVAQRLGQARPGARLGAWLSRPGAADALAGRAADGLPTVLRGLESPDLRRLFAETVGEQLRATRLGPLLGRSMDIVLTGDHHAPLIDRMVRSGRDYIDRHEGDLERMVERRTAWWIPRRVDRRMARSIAQALRELLAELGQPGSHARVRLEEALRALAFDLQHRSPSGAAVDRAKERLLDTPEIQTVLGDLWDALRRTLDSDLATDQSRTRQALATALTGLGQTLTEDERARANVDALALQLVEAVIVPARQPIARFVADVVRGWDSRTVVDRLELAVGPDLQYVRISGTLVATLIGSAIYLAVHGLPG